MAGKRTLQNQASPKKPPLSHFLCIPLVTPASKLQLETALSSFRDTVCSDTPDQDSDDEDVKPSIHPKAIRPVGALHCTLGVMSLDATQLQAAIDLLYGLDVRELLQSVEKAKDGADELKSLAPLKVDLKGLESMHDPKRTSILYSKPSDASNRLVPFCLAIQQAFAGRKLLVPDDRELKLHATIVNTIYAKGRYMPGRAGSSRAQGHGPNAKAAMKIDATKMLEQFRDFVFAKDLTLDRIAICEMGAKKVVGPDGKFIGEEYNEVATVRMPTS